MISIIRLLLNPVMTVEKPGLIPIILPNVLAHLEACHLSLICLLRVLTSKNAMTMPTTMATDKFRTPSEHEQHLSDGHSNRKRLSRYLLV